jgi:hypothetical protein
MRSTTQSITMPRKTKRKLSLDRNVNDAIPYSKVRVEWIDILSDSGWADEKGFNKMKLAFPVNEGWLLFCGLCTVLLLSLDWFQRLLQKKKIPSSTPSV